MPRPIRDAAESIQNAADWAAELLFQLSGGRQIQVKTDVKRLLAGDWGGLEFRLKPEDVVPVPEEPA